MNKNHAKCLLISLLLITNLHSAYSQNRPNVILIFPDNIGVGEVNAYGGVRGVPTPNIDKIGKENRLLITTTLPYQNPKNGMWQEHKTIQTLWLEDDINAPWEPKLVVETFREGVLGGLNSTNRTVYSKGYR